MALIKTKTPEAHQEQHLDRQQSADLPTAPSRNVSTQLEAFETPVKVFN